MKKILPPILFALCLLVMALLDYLLPVARIDLVPLSLVGVVLFCTGLGIAIAENRHFSRVGTNIMTFDNPDKLVTDGLFRFSRNPMYYIPFEENAMRKTFGQAYDDYCEQVRRWV